MKRVLFLLSAGRDDAVRDRDARRRSDEGVAQ